MLLIIRVKEETIIYFITNIYFKIPTFNVLTFKQYNFNTK